MSKLTLGVIVGNRDFFPDRLVTEARQDILALFEKLDIEPIILNENDTKLGGVETWDDAKKCAELFRAHRERIDGVLVTLPNFGDEKGIADTMRLSGLQVPILIQAYPDDLDRLFIERRRDAFCGKISAANVLRQYGYPYTLTEDHTVHPCTDDFKADLQRFAGVCRVVRGLHGVRLGAVGARPNAFNTVRFSEKLLEASGISVLTVDLSEVFGWIGRLPDDDAKVTAKLDQINAYTKTSSVPAPSLVRQAKLAVVLERWMKDNDIAATALQCWNSIQRNFGVNACTIMSMMSDQLMPSACEVDITGVATMYALQLASGTPSALVDWNNNYAGDKNKCVLFHCGNWAKSFFTEHEMRYADVLATTLGVENTYGAISGRTPAGPMTYARVSTDDVNGCIRAYVGEGEFTDDPLETFGARAVVEVPALQRLLKYICKNGFEHHAAMNASHSAAILTEAFETYMGWQTYWHEG